MSERRKERTQLRRRAEERLAKRRPRDEPIDEVDAKRLLHDLQIHQIELELQNDELQRSRFDTEALLRRYTELFEFAPIGFFHVAHDGTIGESNFAGARLLGLPRGVLIGRAFASFVRARDRGAFERFLAAVLTHAEGRDPVSETEEVHLVRTGGEIVARVTGGCLEQGPAPSALLAVEDITARRWAEEALREETRRKDEFLAALSHELRNPLAPIRNALSLLEVLPPGSEKAPTALAIIGRQVSHLSRVVEDLLDVTRIARGKVHLQRERLDLGGLVRRTVEDHRLGFEERGVKLWCDGVAERCWVDGDASRLAQALGNLLGNALKFTNPGGRVEVTLACQPEEAVLRVRDTGIGISTWVQKRLFEPFSQGPQSLDRSRGGLGLGLTTVKGLVELHGGKVEVASEGPGRGAEFAVRLPLAAPPARPQAGLARANVSPQRVLVIEDNQDAAESLKDLLELGGHEVRVARDGPSGLNLARAFRPDVILCDIGLPGMSGYDVAHALRWSEDPLRDAFLVALSGYATPEDARQAAASGFDRHIAKPATPEVLAEVLAEASRAHG